MKFGCHDFLNSKPITYAFTEKLLDCQFDLVLEKPSTLADMLAACELDLAVIPSIEFARSGAYALSDAVAISSLGPVWTVLLFTKGDLSGIKSIAVDNASRTSSALAKIIMKERHDVEPKLIPCEPDAEKMLETADAGLIIGDRTFNIDRKNLNCLDLGEEWHKLTGHAFVHAVLAVRPGVDADNAISAITEAVAIGVKNIDKISKAESKRLNVNEDVVREYLTERIRYRLGDTERAGLNHFLSLSEKHGLLANTTAVRPGK